MEKKLYQKPEMTVIFMDSDDIVCTSNSNSDNLLCELDKLDLT